jgi:hypothetical protein
MRILNALLVASFFLFSGCSVAKEKKSTQDVYRPVDGTKTAVVGLPLNKDGSPKESLVKLKIYVYPGGKVVFAGPDQFSIYFKNKKSPTGVLRESSKEGVVAVKVPENLFELPEFREEYKDKKSVTFDFGIVAGGKDIDPQIVVIRQN